MEAIRDDWKKSNSSIDLTSFSNESNIRLNDYSNDHIINLSIDTSENIIDVRKSRSDDSYSPCARRRSSISIIDKSVLETVVDPEELLSNNYNLDHQFEELK